MNRQAFLALAALLVSTAFTGRAQSPTLPPGLRERVAAIADSARRERLPADLLEAKAAEGVAKGADNDAIITVVAEYRRLLMRAREILGNSAQSGELAAAASALKTGIAERLVADVKRAAGDRAATVPLVVLTDLVTRGIRAADAASAIRALTADGASDIELTALRRAVAQDIAGGRDPMTTLRARMVRSRPPLAPALAAPPLEVAAGTSLGGRGDSRLDDWRAAVGYRSSSLGARLGVAQWLPASGSAARESFGFDAEGWFSIRPDLAIRASVAQFTGAGSLTGTGGERPVRPDSGGCVAPVSNPQACSQSRASSRASSSMAASVLWARRHWLFDAGGGTSVLGSSARWITLGATRWITPGLGATVSAGGDPRIAGATSVIRAGLLFRPFARATDRSVAGAGALHELLLDLPEAARVEARTDGSRVLVVRAPAARLVEVRGDATGWQPQSLTRQPIGEWHFALPFAPGLHHVQVRLDGAAWAAPAGLPVVTDDFRGMVGVIVQP